MKIVITKKIKLFIFSVLIIGLSCGVVSANSLVDRLKGKILLQVQQNGEAWYINPENSLRYYMGRPADAFALMRTLGLGISEDNYFKFKNNNNTAPINLSGKIILRVEKNGEAYYINPDDNKMHYLGRPADAFAIMRQLGLGITDNDLSQIIEFKNNNQTGEKCGNDTCNSNEACANFEGDMTCLEIVDCHEPHYTMAFVLLETEEEKGTEREIEYLNEIKDRFPERFNWATRGLATMDTSYPIQKLIIKEDDYDHLIVKKFYEDNPDQFDFITFYWAFDFNGVMSHSPALNDILGIGSYSVCRNNHRSKLKGSNYIKNIAHSLPEYNRRETEEQTMVLEQNYLLHETLHRWGVDINYLDENGVEQYDLHPRKGDPHWTYYLNLKVPHPHKAGYWIDNKDGTFTSKDPYNNTIGEVKQTITDIDLYLMGLISKEQVQPLELIVLDQEITQTVRYGESVKAHAKYITIDQIIAAEGERRCVKIY